MYSVEKRSPLKKTFNYDELADIRSKVDDIATIYYNDLKNVAKDNSKIVKRELLVDEIKKERSRNNFVQPGCFFRLKRKVWGRETMLEKTCLAI